ncbi:hypothetical protein DF3PB_2820002 [uncultured Defluviicoccus sp.]|uniref:Uncharacterized protein n=1 Tax=metagenome TaxID=256318 RepID=A0A380TD89_9ZZZZ|nr:hypothetical protein DF3PB_2820002 [uncultured Defluviicoccus sp.]
MSDTAPQAQNAETPWYDAPWISEEKFKAWLSCLRPSDTSLAGVPLADAFKELVRSKVENSYERGYVNPEADGRWLNDRLFEIETQLAFLDFLKNGTLLAFGQSGSTEWQPPRGYWSFIEIKHIDFERCMFFPSDPARSVYGVMIAPAPDISNKKPGPQCIIKDKIITNMREYVKEHGQEALSAIKVASLPIEFGGRQTTAYEARKLVLSENSARIAFPDEPSDQ